MFEEISAAPRAVLTEAGHVVRALVGAWSVIFSKDGKSLAPFTMTWCRRLAGSIVLVGVEPACRLQTNRYAINSTRKSNAIWDVE